MAIVFCISDANLQEYENMENMPRPEEDREIEIEKNKRLQQQLKVICLREVVSLVVCTALY